jgi:excinuclease ABC subunit A
VNLPISEAGTVFSMLELSDRESIIAGRILKEIQDRLRFLNDVGVGYLTIGRSAATLSGGEGQRIRLATQIGSNLTGVLYVLDEPSIGLHQRDNRKLLGTLSRLRDLGNTVIVVEHDEDDPQADQPHRPRTRRRRARRPRFSRAARGAARHRPRLIGPASGPALPKGPPNRATGAYLRGERRIGSAAARRPARRAPSRSAQFARTT